MSLPGRLAFGLTELLRGSTRMRALAEIRGTPWLPPEAVREHQLDLLRRVLAHAETNVPYYRELFRSIGFRSADLRSLDDLAQLPVLTKETVRERQADLLARNFRPGDLERHHSGGSTGVPLSFYHDRRYLAYAEAGVLRNFEQAGWKPGDMIAYFWGFNRHTRELPSWNFEVRQWLRRQYQFDSFQAGEESFERWYRKWSLVRPRIAFGYAYATAAFAQYLVDTGRTVPPLKGVFTTAEKLFPHQREVMERAFGCQVFDCYGSSEVRNVAAECPNGRMHINADFVVLETDDRPLDDTEEDAARPFIVTSLRAYGMPFIRYVNGDCGRLQPGTCTCGRGFPVLQLDVGRVNDHFVFPNGRTVHGLFFIHQFYGSEGVANFQFHQTAPDRVVLRVVAVKGAEAACAASVAKAVEMVKRVSDGTAEVTVEQLDAIPLTGAGKHRYVRSDVAPELSAPGR